MFSITVYTTFVSVGFSMGASVFTPCMCLSGAMVAMHFQHAESRDMAEFVAFETSPDIRFYKEWFALEDLHFLQQAFDIQLLYSLYIVAVYDQYTVYGILL